MKKKIFEKKSEFKCDRILKGRNFGGSQKWRNLAEFNLADHEKL